MSTESYIYTDIESSSKGSEGMAGAGLTGTASAYSSNFESEGTEEKQESGLTSLKHSSLSHSSIPDLPPALSSKLLRLLRKNETLRKVALRPPSQRKAIFRDKIHALNTENPPYKCDFPVEMPLGVVETVRRKNGIAAVRREIELISSGDEEGPPQWEEEGEEERREEDGIGLALLKVLRVNNRHKQPF